MAAGGGTRAVVAALLANAGIAVAKFVGFLVTGASSMLAEAVHSVADSGNQALLLLGGKRAAKAADEEHPFGYGRERYFWGFVVSLVLFTLGSVFAIYEGIEKLRHPHEVDSLGVALGILGLAIALEGWSFRTAVVESNRLRGEASWTSFVRNAKSPELPVVLLEDLGAIVGLVIAFVALVVSAATDEPMWDGVGTVGIGVLLGVIAITLAIEMKSLLIGEGATRAHRAAIVAAIADTPGVERLIHLRTQHVGPDELLVAAKLAFDAELSVAEMAATVDAVEERIRDAVPIARIIYLEPDLYRSDTSTSPG